jgi:hypothetical protein
MYLFMYSFIYLFIYIVITIKTVTNNNVNITIIRRIITILNIVTTVYIFSIYNTKCTIVCTCIYIYMSSIIMYKSTRV